MDKEQNNYFSSILILSKINAIYPPSLSDKGIYNKLLEDGVIKSL